MTRPPLWFSISNGILKREDGPEAWLDRKWWMTGLSVGVQGDLPDDGFGTSAEAVAWVDEHVPLGPPRPEFAVAVLAMEVRRLVEAMASPPPTADDRIKMIAYLMHGLSHEDQQRLADAVLPPPLWQHGLLPIVEAWVWPPK